MNGVKSAFKSRTVWAAIVAIAGSGLAIAGYSISEDDKAAILELGAGIVSAVGGFGAIYYRLIASKKIGASNAAAGFSATRRR